tara:strand:+ start:294 stop:500 length:207 start_codon:yes stop_codon:yes gene_type:complete
MTDTVNEKMYHIYAKDVCLYSGLDKDEFERTWTEVKGMVGLMKTEYSVEDLSYEELNYSREAIIDSSH